MKLVSLDPKQAVGGVLIHNIADSDGHKALNKGHRLTAADVETLSKLGRSQVLVGVFETGDVAENDAAARVGAVVAGQNITATAPTGGRINLLADKRGVVSLDEDALTAINLLDGITIATIPAYTVVAPKKMVATIKTIGLAVPEASLAQAEQIGRGARNVVNVRELKPMRVGVILTGSTEARGRVDKALTPPIHSRIEELGGSIVRAEYVEHDAAAIAQAIVRAREQDADCIILAGETSIMDASDATPSGILQAGGEIQVYGAPVEPGNLLLLAYAGDVPIVGAPGCVKSRDMNVVDLILPRLFAGERLTKREIVKLANGGLLI